MSEQNYSIETDLKEAQSMVGALEDYLRQDALYGSVGGGIFGSGRMPSLTVGALLMRLRRLNALREQLTADQRTQLGQIEAAHEQTRGEWRKRYDEKIAREAHSRLDAMRQFFEECAESPRSCASNYLPEALRRTIVQELVPMIEAEGLNDEQLSGKMKAVDSRLRRFTTQAPFLWDTSLQPLYPESTYWWLYQRPEDPTKR